MDPPNTSVTVKQLDREIQAKDWQIAAKNLVAGGVAGAVSRTVVAPLERTKILLQVSSRSAMPITHFLSKQVHDEGWMALFKGNATNIARIIPYSAVQYTVYEGSKKSVERRNSTSGRLLSGAMAGIVSVLVTYPLDLVRTRQSLPSSVQKGILQCAEEVMKKEGGLFALYRGLGPTLIGVAPYVALNFTVYESLKAAAVKRKGDGQLTVTERLAYGGTAGAVAQTITYPLDVIRRRMQVASIQGQFAYSGSVDAVRKIMLREGWRALYRGLLPNYLKVVPAISVSFVTFEGVNKLL